MPANDQIVGTAEIAEMCGVTPAAVSNWISRGTDDFPQPFATLRSGTIFLEKEIIAWMLRTNRAGKWIVERMAESAHNSWWETYKSLGYKSRKAAWGEEFMVPFDELSDQGKEFDRMIMRAILAAFDQMGLKVVSDAPTRN